MSTRMVVVVETEAPAAMVGAALQSLPGTLLIEPRELVHSVGPGGQDDELEVLRALSLPFPSAAPTPA